MNWTWFARNLHSAWHHCDRPVDFIKRLLWLYSNRVPSPKTLEIGFKYPVPIGRCRLAVRANDGSDAFIHGEVFEHEYYKLPLPHDPLSILDLGANAGFTAVYFSRLYPAAKIACVEPIQSNLDILRRNLKLNNVDAAIFAAAVADSDGVVEMQLNAKDYGHKVITTIEAPGGSTIQVRSMSISSIMQELGWDRIGLLKIDIEGYEKTLFSGACNWLNAVDNLCIECHEGFGETDLRHIASAYGFLTPRRLEGTWLLTRN